MFSLLGMATMKENKGKEVMDEAAKLGAQSQTRPSTRDKRKSLPKTLDFGNLPSLRGKKAKHRSSRPEIAKSNLPPSQPSIQIVDIDSSVPADSPTKTIVPPLIQDHYSYLVPTFLEDPHEPPREWRLGLREVWEGTCPWKSLSTPVFMIFLRYSFISSCF